MSAVCRVVPHVGRRALGERYRLNRSWSRTLGLTAEVSYLTDVDNRLLACLAAFEVSDELPSGDEFSFRYERQFEQLTEDFEIQSDPSIVIPLAAYRFDRGTVSWQSEASRRLVTEAAFSRGSFFGGQRHDLSVGNTYYFHRQFDAGWEVEHNRGQLTGGDFTTSLARVRLNYNSNSNVGVGGLLQWNSTTDEFSANIRLRILYGRDSDVFFVYNERQLAEAGGWRLAQQALIFKITYRLYL
jgi:hypothetical protein